MHRRVSVVDAVGMSVVPGAPRRRGLGVVGTLAVVFGVFVGAVFLVGLVIEVGRGPGATAVPTRSVAAPVDSVALAGFWATNYADRSWYGLADSPVWDGSAVTVRSKLVAGRDAVEPAMAMCAAVGAFYLESGTPFQWIRIVDGADQILVSRRSGGQCEWRR